MLNAIIVLGIILTLVILYVVYAYVETPAGHFSIVGDFGGKELKTLKSGWTILPKPLQKILVTPRVELKNVNIKSFPLTCMIQDFAGTFDLNTQGTIELKSGEVSFSYKVQIPDNAEELALFFQQYPITVTEKDGKKIYTLDYKQVEERLKDLIQEEVKNRAARLGILSAISSQASIARDVLAVVQDHTIKNPDFKDEQLMLELVSVNINEPFQPANAELRKELDKKAQATVQLSSAKEETERQIFLAAQQVKVTEQEQRQKLAVAQASVEIAQYNAAAKAAEIRKLMETLGPGLDAATQLEAYKTIYALDAMKEAKGTMVLGAGGLLALAENLIGRMSGGKA